MNPQDRHVLEHAGIAERPRVDWTEPRMGRHLGDELLRREIVAGQEDLRARRAREEGILVELGPERVEALDDPGLRAFLAMAAAMDPSGGGVHTGPSSHLRGLLQSTTTLPRQSGREAGGQCVEPSATAPA
jgi:hypothetical protein